MTTMIRPALAGVAFFMLAACGGGLDDPRGVGTSTTAGLSCSAAASCPAFSCRCNDGTRWDTARYCFNNVCQGQTATCENACKDRRGVASTSPGTGGGSAGGSSGGGTAIGATCSVAATCPAFSCTCSDGSRWDTARYCLNNLCQGQAATCANACKDRSSSGTATVIGCELRKWSNDHSVTMVTYGAGSTESSATSQASSQCSDADWASWFCSSAADYCAPEPARSTTCRFSKYSSSAGRTVQFTGSGLGETAAKRAAVAACLASGNWRGWFCTSGTLSCSP
ncbi:MAG: hypothetical protein MUC96_09475 [Myxococcaceae bacterium]|nr:hypothetical protein [Myxococcaceae bacterium]